MADPEVATMLGALRLADGAGLVITGTKHGLRARLLDASGQRAAPGSGAATELVRWWAQGAPTEGFWPRWYGQAPLFGAEAAVSTDQANESVATGNVLVKVQRKPVLGADSALLLPRHLAAVGFPHQPEPVGDLTSSHDGRRALVATANRYLAGAEEGWVWGRTMLDDLLEGEREPEDTAEVVAELARVVARFHIAMATASDLLPDPVARVGPDRTTLWRNRALDTLAAALTSTTGDAGLRLRSRAGRIRSRIELLATVDATPVLRVHGDLHIGQLLRHDGRYLLTDLDGDPLASADVRNEPDAPARDVAALLRSLEHLVFLVERRRGERGNARLRRWVAVARTALLDSYRAELDQAGHADLLDERLLAPLEAVQLLHEYVYAAERLPSWGYVPDQALDSLFPEGHRGP